MASVEQSLIDIKHLFNKVVFKKMLNGWALCLLRCFIVYGR